MPEDRHALDAPDVAVPEQGPVPPDPEETTPAGPQAPAGPEVTPDTAGAQRPLPPRRTRISATWVAIGCFTVVLLFALLFILQNSHSVDISYFGAHGHLPLGVALLLAGLCGAVLVGLAGTARILQLRSHARRQRKQS
jgi:uncharacterized integral membrane protein